MEGGCWLHWASRWHVRITHLVGEALGGSHLQQLPGNEKLAVGAEGPVNRRPAGLVLTGRRSDTWAVFLLSCIGADPFSGRRKRSEIALISPVFPGSCFRPIILLLKVRLSILAFISVIDLLGRLLKVSCFIPNPPPRAVCPRAEL